MKEVFRVIQDEYSQATIKCTFTNIDLDMFTDPDAPRASPPNLNGKAAECRHLVRIVHKVWVERFSREHNAATPPGQQAHDGHVTEVLRTLKDINLIIDSRADPKHVPLYLTAEGSDEFRDLINRF
jgi:hypothetical protein